MKNTTLRLTDAEMKRWESLPAERTEGWEVEREDGVAYESPDVLKIRAGMARFDSFPALRAVVDAAMHGKKIDLAAVRDMPESVLPELCFTIGAVGMTVLIGALFAELASDEDVAAIAAMTSIRHDILTTNASVTAPA